MDNMLYDHVILPVLGLDIAHIQTKYDIFTRLTCTISSMSF